MVRLALLAALAASLLPSCASIVSSGPDLVPINSDPPGATIYVDGEAMDTTPAVVPLSRQKTKVVELRLDGYHDQVVVVGKQVNGWVVGNIVFGGIIGILVDVASGNASQFDTKPMTVPLVASSEAKPGPYAPPKPRRDDAAAGGQTFPVRLAYDAEER
jgi:hypothetical protein